jgi:probable phosphoglycerate mutase
MPVLYFMRHGQTDWNAQGHIQGHTDVPINALGRTQALQNGGVLAEVIDDVDEVEFVSSPLLRARETMEIIRAAMGLPAGGYKTDTRLREVSFGIWSGKTMEQCEHDFPEHYQARMRDIWNFCVPGGESFQQLNDRVLAWFSGVERDTVCVAHGGVMRCLRGHALKLKPDEIIRLDVPQDKVLMIDGTMLAWI